ncbi:hypothetical protein [Lolliginicoccus suaedae]|uniref:hypothetical protein n=1 Tax=Lolliginicoccus suaedae TaxID=2605429 RepID=UPI0011EFE5CB|nr:hypothetical protein [Lolliginicoccus suaedae]
MILAHGLGGRSDLPVPLWMALYAGAAAVLVSFVALAFLWKKPLLRGDKAGHPLPRPLERFADHPVTRSILAGLGLLALAILLAALWLGTDDSTTNPGPTWFYVWFWIGLIPVSLLLGPIYRLANPLRTLAAALHPLLGRARLASGLDKLGHWPAVASLGAFLWLELVHPASDSPRVVAVFVTGYAIIMVLAGAIAGPRWFDQCDGFEVYFILIARLSPFGRRADRRLVVRNPLDGLIAGSSKGLTPILILVLGATTFDGVTRIPAWAELTRGLSPAVSALSGTAALAGTIAAMGAMYALAMWLTRPYLRKTRTSQPGIDPYDAFAHTLIPLALGYTIAHYFSFAIFQGQAGYLLATDPLGQGWELLGATGSIDYTIVSTTTIAIVQVAAIITGHIIAVAAAHDQSLRIIRPSHRSTGQFPALALMVGYTMIGIMLVSSA